MGWGILHGLNDQSHATCRMDHAVTASMRMEVLVDPASIAGAVVNHDQTVFAKVAPLTVKVLGLDQHGTAVGEFSGFLHDSVIVTAGHAMQFCGKATGSTSPVQAFKAVYPDGTEEAVQVLFAPPPSNIPDLMLLKGSHKSEPFRGKAVTMMETVYAFGYSGGEGLQAGQLPSCSKGSIASVVPGAVAITAHADDGFSGGPVVDILGRLVGVVQGGMGTTILRVGIIPSYDVHSYLLQAGQPGLSR